MGIRSWGDVPPGMPVHHHCVWSYETANDPKHWIDGSTARPDLVAWQYPEVVEWVRERLEAHRDQDADAYKTPGSTIADRLAEYVPTLTGLDADHFADCFDVDGQWHYNMWRSFAQGVQMGRWSLTPFNLGSGRKLVLHLIGFADRGQPSGIPYHNVPYRVCDQHERPADKPYLGLNHMQSEHSAKYGVLYDPSIRAYAPSAT